MATGQAIVAPSPASGPGRLIAPVERNSCVPAGGATVRNAYYVKYILSRDMRDGALFSNGHLHLTRSERHRSIEPVVTMPRRYRAVELQGVARRAVPRPWRSSPAPISPRPPALSHQPGPATR